MATAARVVYVAPVLTMPNCFMVMFAPAVSYFTEHVALAFELGEMFTRTMDTVLASDVVILKLVHDAVVVPMVLPAPAPSLANAI